MDTKTATGDTVAPPTVDVVPMLQPERAGRGSRTDCTHFGSPRWGLLGQPRLTPGHFANRTPVRLTKVTRNCRQHLSLDDLTDLQLYARVAGTGQHQSHVLQAGRHGKAGFRTELAFSRFFRVHLHCRMREGHVEKLLREFEIHAGLLGKGIDLAHELDDGNGGVVDAQLHAVGDWRQLGNFNHHPSIAGANRLDGCYSVRIAAQIGCQLGRRSGVRSSDDWPRDITRSVFPMELGERAGAAGRYRGDAEVHSPWLQRTLNAAFAAQHVQN